MSDGRASYPNPPARQGKSRGRRHRSQPALGLAVALIRRCREIVWIVAGFALGWRYAFRAKMVAMEFTDAAGTASGEGGGPQRRPDRGGEAVRP